MNWQKKYFKDTKGHAIVQINSDDNEMFDEEYVEYLEKNLNIAIEALKKYGNHTYDCPLWEYGIERCMKYCDSDYNYCLEKKIFIEQCNIYLDMKCTCGYDEALQKIEGEK